MSKTTVKINNIKRKLDSISGLDGDYVQERLEKIENLVNKTVEEIEKHCIMKMRLMEVYLKIQVLMRCLKS